jgi:hypothetical protein
VQDSDSLKETNLALCDVLADIENMSIESLEMAVDMTKTIREAFLNSSMEAPLSVWDNILHRLETEILERTLLKQCTTSNTTASTT